MRLMENYLDKNTPKSFADCLAEFYSHVPRDYFFRLEGVLRCIDRRGRVREIPNVPSMLAAYADFSGITPAYKRAAGFVSLETIFAAVYDESREFAGIFPAPFWTGEGDDDIDANIMLSKAANLDADASGDCLVELAQRFSAATPEDTRLIMALFAAPFFAVPNAPRPMWIIDTVDAQGSGKTTLAHCVARMYGDSACLPLDIEGLKSPSGAVELKRKIMHGLAAGRRVCLFDNIVGTLRAREVIELATSPFIECRAPYARASSKVENLATYIFTINGAQVNSDMAERCFTIRLRKPKAYDRDWLENTQNFIDANRDRILAEIAARFRMVRRGDIEPLADNCRFPEFANYCVAGCGASLATGRTDGNIDRETVEEIVQDIENDIIAHASKLEAEYNIPKAGIVSIVPKATVAAFLKERELVYDKMTLKQFEYLIRAEKLSREVSTKFKRLGAKYPSEARARGFAFGVDGISGGIVPFQVLEKSGIYWKVAYSGECSAGNFI